MTTWNPTQYLQFGNERLRPAVDLMARIPLREPATVYDLGCGAGAATALLKDRWPSARVMGVDGSPEMLARARAQRQDIQWQHADLETWQPDGQCDLLYSNAALHWLDNHDALFPRLVSLLKPGGVLAVQMPENFSAPSHTSIAEVVRSRPWQAKLGPRLRENPTLAPSVYFGLLSGRVSSIDMWETSYHHVLQGENPVVEWTKGSILQPLLAVMDEAETKLFLEEYGQRVRKAYPQGPDGKTVLPFKRLFFVAVK